VGWYQNVSIQDFITLYNSLEVIVLFMTFYKLSILHYITLLELKVKEVVVTTEDIGGKKMKTRDSCP